MGVNILDLIDGAIEAHEVSSDAMRWTAEPAGHLSIIDETHLWTSEIVRYAEEVLGFNLTLWQQETIRRVYLNAPVSSGLSREANPASTERTTP